MACCPFPLPSVPRCDEPEAYSVIAIRPWSFLSEWSAFQVLFFPAAWLLPLISEPPDMTWITRSCHGGETGAASVGLHGSWPSRKGTP
ncbi:hypothetical protein F2Q69_00006027 [Brassica cretica]|uniref:Uncharacterized protein n=1 Tax=Brassica cretica TaxID=69181 RepID=A0A8S9NQR4_BRACR|nr:hypothetical protein F2Q69_00006027 [Brassica cretica]